VPKRRSRYGLLSTLAFACAMSASALAEDATKSTGEKWRPKEGLYASPGKGFAEACGEFRDISVELRDKKIGGYEWSCKVRKLTDTAPDAIRIETTCDDYNLATNLNRPEETKFKEVILLKRVDEKSMMVRKTLDGKFKDPEWKAVYCPKEVQQTYHEAKARDRDEAQRKAATKSSAPEAAKW